MRLTLLIVGVATLAGCGPFASPLTTPDGHPGYFVRCRDTKEGCFRKALNVCPSGYRIVDNTTIAPTEDTDAFFEMLIQCNVSWENVDRRLQHGWTD